LLGDLGRSRALAHVKKKVNLRCYDTVCIARDGRRLKLRKRRCDKIGISPLGRLSSLRMRGRPVRDL